MRQQIVFGFFLIAFSLLKVESQAQTLPSYLPSNGLVGWWPFNGNANDESGNGTHGTVSGVALGADRFGNANGAFIFNGINCCGTPDAVQEVAITNSLLNLASDFTISIWMNSSNVSKYQQCLFNSINHTGFAVELNNEHVPSRLTYGAGPANAFWDLIYAQGNSVNFTNEAWYHVVFVKSGITYKVYLNTILDGQTDLPVSVGYNQNVGIRIGSIGDGHEVFKGRLDDVAIYNRVLTSTEIAALYNAQNIPTVTSGCMDATACNFNASATLDDGSCTFPTQTYLNCDGNCINDTDADGICDELETPTIPSYIPSNGLVGYWPFNGNANDESGNGNHGLNYLGSFVEDRTGLLNSSFHGQGSGSGMSILNLNNFPFGNSNRSISVWFKCELPFYGAAQSLFCYGDNTFATRFNLYLTPNQIGVEYMNGLVYSSFVPDNQWHHFIATYDGNGSNGIRVFLDGIEKSMTIYNATPSLNTLNSFIRTIGRFNDMDFFIGDYDDIAIYNRALPQEEITALYTGTSSNNNGGGGSGSTAGTPAASVPAAIPYQAVIRDNTGAALVNTPVTVRFTLHENTTSGTTEYQETQSLTTNTLGLINTQFGSGTATQGTFAGINWSNTTKFIQVEANTGAGYVNMGTQQMMSVPFAIQANKATAIKNAGLPVYADNAAALAGGLVAGEMYRTAAGILMIVF